MKKIKLRYKIVISILFIILISVMSINVLKNAFYFRSSHVSSTSGISRNVKPANYNFGKLKELPSYDRNSDNGFQIDLRSRDISNLNLAGRAEDLMYSDFDSKTKWPASLPKEFNIDTIMKNGKDPGLNIKKLHEKQITGKGVNIAIIDQVLLTNHEEYKDRIKFYEEIHAANETSMHGPAVTSIAVGKNVGVAPEANVYYIATAPMTLNVFHGQNMDYTYIAKAIDRILEINKELPEDNKIRVISTSIGWDEREKGFKEVDEAVKRAQKENIFVVSSSLSKYYPYDFNGLGRDPLSAPDDVMSYKPGIWWEKSFNDNPKSFEEKINKTIMVPMDSRCIASPTGVSDYAFNRNGGWSWAVPYISGLYALCCQVKPDITPEMFFEEAINTGSIINVAKDGKNYKLGTIVNPEKLIERLQGSEKK